MYYDSLKDKICQRGCNMLIIWKGKTGQRFSTGWFNFGDEKTEHTYDFCNKQIEIIETKKKHGNLFPTEQHMKDDVKYDY